MSKSKKTLLEDMKALAKKHGYTQCIAMLSTREGEEAEVLGFGMTRTETRSNLLQLMVQVEGAVND